jgi:hypothetical protein
VRRHTAILRGLARELSNDSDRLDRPETAKEAQARFEAHLEELATQTPRAGLAAATGAFIDDLRERYLRYGEHLFHCFDDARIPATSNELEGFFGGSKQVLRSALGCGSTSNSVVSNLGAEALLAYHQIRQKGALEELERNPFTAEEFLQARAKQSAQEKPMIRQRSMVRHLDRHLDRLTGAWFRAPPTTEVYA